ncbi:amino acid ABC transporter permease [Denitromonas iodatirespirans]|uniref:ABC transporter permease subunit n=1 Tax=Denitromonas iodatirespirans TaxID=2795389 RepID=A0A944DPR8_DENI1|nr:ABC transporter permease subunit [Denitromonas iodatirespirans]MBT0962404.1 ABC transporter permease subunit [Denitromonas iodatirespirans]
MTLHYDFDWSILAQAQYVHWLAAGLGWTLLIGVLAMVGSLLVGALLATLQALPGIVGATGRAWGQMARNIPCLFWLLLFYAGVPALFGSNGIPWDLSLLQFGFACAVGALLIDNTTYVADALLDGIRAVSRDERQAALACGLSERQTVVECVLPQAVRFAMPALLNRSVHVIKNTALCMAIGVPEMMWAAQQIESITFRGIEATLVVSGIYLTLGWGLASLTRRIGGTRGAQEAFR